MFGRPSLRDLFAEMREESQRRDRDFKLLVEETREYNREILLRNEKVYMSVIAQLDRNTAQMHSNTVQMESNTEETRAQTQALLSLIDRMNETGGAAAA